MTIGVFLAVYMSRLGAFSDNEQTAVLATGVLAAGVAAAIAGRLVGRAGAKTLISAALPIFAAALALAGITARPWAVWVAAVATGATLGIIWTADRVLMLRLSPPSHRGEFFAYFNIANRGASAIGPLLIWSGLVWLLHHETNWLSELEASRVAIGVLALTALLGWGVLRTVQEPSLVARPASSRQSSQDVV